MNDMICDMNIKQDLPTSCAVKCQQIILRDYGVDVSEKELRDIAAQNRWYEESVGTYMRNNGKLLGCFGIGYHHSQYNDILKLTSELNLGHRVMVNLNRAKLFGEKEKDRHHEACHAVIVTQISHEDGCVFVMDPANGDARQQHTIQAFVESWKDSNCYMLATDTKAIFQYDAKSQTMKKIN